MDLELYIQHQHVLSADKRYLVAVSGGIDSSVLLHVLCRLKYHVVVAHCNFHLRGADSDGDALFVKQLCSDYGVECCVTEFDTKQYAAEHKLSIEMAARNLRYGWFEQLCREKGCDYVVVGHHSDDDVETFFLNLIRGSGLQGLSGMRTERDYVLRPFLGMSRAMIEQYAKEQGLSFREDVSNHEQVYYRNRLRLDILPRLRSMNPSLNSTILETAERLNDANKLIHCVAGEIFSEVTRRVDEWLVIDLSKLQKYDGITTLLHVWLSDYGFSKEQLLTIASLPLDSSGQRFKTREYMGIYSRGELFVGSLNLLDCEEDVVIEEKEGSYGCDVVLTLNFVPFSSELLNREHFKGEAFDRASLLFPLTLRRWKRGDRFAPLGMHGTKKVSDLMTDLKLTPEEKNNVHVLVSASGEIAWIVGYRISRRFALNSETTQCCVFRVVD